MELSDAVAQRRMVRSFADLPVDASAVDAMVDMARRAPSAGHSQAVRFLVLDTREAVAGYWDLSLPAERRAGFAWPGLVTAPVLIVVLVDPWAYVERYQEPDKASTGLGDGLDSWSVPYWWVDAGAAAQTLLLAAVDAGLGASLFGLFGAEGSVCRAHDVPRGWRAVATIAIGHPDGADRPGRSAARARRPWGEVVRRDRWA